jgi:hypothetical protein
MREICTSGSVREPAGDRWLYSAANPTINALYCTLLHAAGKPRDTFNSTGIAAPCGPLPELLE